jgi:hypothetical protein
VEPWREAVDIEELVLKKNQKKKKGIFCLCTVSVSMYGFATNDYASCSTIRLYGTVPPMFISEDSHRIFIRSEFL